MIKETIMGFMSSFYKYIIAFLLGLLIFMSLMYVYERVRANTAVKQKNSLETEYKNIILENNIKAKQMEAELIQKARNSEQNFVQEIAKYETRLKDKSNEIENLNNVIASKSERLFDSARKAVKSNQHLCKASKPSASSSRKSTKSKSATETKRFDRKVGNQMAKVYSEPAQELGQSQAEMAIDMAEDFKQLSLQFSEEGEQLELQLGEQHNYAKEAYELVNSPNSDN